MKNDNNLVKYDRHREEWKSFLNNPEKNKLGEAWLEGGSIDSWRHERMRSHIKTIINDDVEASWLTVGDGRFGMDANALMRMGAKKVHASDISDELLRQGKEKGLISEFSAQNAESLSFNDSAFDYVYCKQSLHHFPRPYIALFEMFRVARRGVVITEPRDHVIDKAKFSSVLTFLKLILRHVTKVHSFEPVGNYVYSMSEREIEKFLLGMHHNHVAYFGLNDFYSAGVEFAQLDSTLEKDKNLKNKVHKKIMYQDILTKLGLKKSTSLTSVLFKGEPSKALIDDLARNSWVYKRLPVNPYLSN